MSRALLPTIIKYQCTLWVWIFFTNLCQANQLNQAVILQYHHVSELTPASTSVSADKFREHLNLINQRGFQVLPLPSILKQIKQGAEFSRKTLGISFDDGYLSIYQHAFPELKKRKLPFTIFVSPQAIDQEHGNSLSWAQLKEMQENGATIANHSLNHAHLLNRKENENLSEWQVRIRHNVQQAQRRLTSELKVSQKLFAYPYGEFNQDLQNLLKEQGYTAFSQQSGPVSAYSHMQALPRFPASGVYANLDTLTTKLESLAFKVVDESPKSEALQFGQAAPFLDLTLLSDDVNYKSIQCFYLGLTIATKVTKQGGQVRVIAHHNSPLRVGRSRYNCTAPSLSQNKFYWYSMPFIMLNEKGEIR